MKTIATRLTLVLGLFSLPAYALDYTGNWGIDTNSSVGLCGEIVIFNQTNTSSGFTFEGQLIWDTDAGPVARFTQGTVDYNTETFTMTEAPFGITPPAHFVYTAPVQYASYVFGALESVPAGTSGRFAMTKLNPGQGYNCI